MAKVARRGFALLHRELCSLPPGTRFEKLENKHVPAAARLLTQSLISYEPALFGVRNSSEMCLFHFTLMLQLETATKLSSVLTSPTGTVYSVNVIRDATKILKAGRSSAPAQRSVFTNLQFLEQCREFQYRKIHWHYAQLKNALPKVLDLSWAARDSETVGPQVGLAHLSHSLAEARERGYERVIACNSTDYVRFLGIHSEIPLFLPVLRVRQSQAKANLEDTYGTEQEKPTETFSLLSNPSNLDTAGFLNFIDGTIEDYFTHISHILQL